ncbi:MULTISPECIES: hypothetical protein [unclassified Gemella]|uniref:hypothetical protein n=1 Tax=unclassified Gemella TaxID=2624949 RepID=UPI001C055BF1|nr:MULTISPECIES: hypothetical protein [unclassified Gemella]MBU0278783.1 hypothetical protein [Gemella sp. zg-1178]QWQ38721.1 hypothetical protein KMP11_07200 [Gemella sp. zg-570]
MKLEKIDKFLLLIANLIFAIYIFLIAVWVGSFREYASTDYLRAKLVAQLREQTKMTMDSANVSTKDLNYIVEIMGKLSYLYIGVFILLLVFIIFLQFKSKSRYIFGYVLLIYTILITIFTLGILFISTIIYFYVGLKLLLRSRQT